MSLRWFVIVMLLGTLLAWASWGLIVWNIDPREAGLPGFLMFYVTLAAAAVGTATLLLALVRIVVFQRKDVPSREIRTSFRQAILVATAAILSLPLAAHGLLRTWHLVVFALLAVVAEYLITHLSRQRR